MAICSKKRVLKRHIPGRGPEIGQSGRGGVPPEAAKRPKGTPRGTPGDPQGDLRRRPQSDEGTNEEGRSTRMN